MREMGVSDEMTTYRGGKRESYAASFQINWEKGRNKKQNVLKTHIHDFIVQVG
jgi:hypothetical protein